MGIWQESTIPDLNFIQILQQILWQINAVVLHHILISIDIRAIHYQFADFLCDAIQEHLNKRSMLSYNLNEERKKGDTSVLLVFLYWNLAVRLPLYSVTPRTKFTVRR